MHLKHENSLLPVVPFVRCIGGFEDTPIEGCTSYGGPASASHRHNLSVVLALLDSPPYCCFVNCCTLDAVSSVVLYFAPRTDSTTSK